MPAGSYKNPPIEEAICEFTFVLPDEVVPFDLTLPGKLQLHEKIKDVYTGPARQQTRQTIAASDQNPALSIRQDLFRVQLTTPDEKRIVSIGHCALAVSSLKPYEKWSQFQPRIVKALEAYYDIVKPISVTRMGIRYINRIVVNAAMANPEDFLSDVKRSHPDLKATLHNFTTRAEYENCENIKIIITQATLEPVEKNSTEFLLDIDAVWDHSHLSRINDIIDKAEKLHAAEGLAFEALVTEKARGLFDAS